MGWIIEQNGKLLIECRDESGKLNPLCMNIPFIFTCASSSDESVIKQEIKRQYDASVYEVLEIFSSTLKSDSSASARFYYVKLTKEISISDMSKKWLSPNVVLKETMGISPKVVDAYLKSKIELIY